MWQFLSVSCFYSLEMLSLKDNCFSDTGVKKLTLPCRLLNDGLGKLSVLDLSLNPKISDNSIKYIVKINTLTTLNLSGTGITLTSGVPNLVDCTGLCLTPEVHVVGVCFASSFNSTSNLLVCFLYYYYYYYFFFDWVFCTCAGIFYFIRDLSTFCLT